MKAFFVFPLLLVISLLFIPSASLASNNTSTDISIFSGINIWVGAYCGEDKITMREGPKGPCDLCDAIIVASNIMRYMFQLVFYILFPVFFAWGGIKYMTSTGNPNKIKEAQQILISTVVGFVIALSAWLIVGLLFYLLSNLSKAERPNLDNVRPTVNIFGGTSANPWNKIEC